MDIISHGLWGGIAFGRATQKSFWTSFLFGIAPDMVAFGPFFTLVLLGKETVPYIGAEPPYPLFVPQYVLQLYSVSHSLFIFGIIFGFLWIWFRRPVYESLALPLHILLDIFTHSTEFFPTPFLWPLAHFPVNGWPWSSPLIFVPNIAILAALYIWFFIIRAHRKSQQ